MCREEARRQAEAAARRAEQERLRKGEERRRQRAAELRRRQVLLLPVSSCTTMIADLLSLKTHHLWLPMHHAIKQWRRLYHSRCFRELTQSGSSLKDHAVQEEGLKAVSRKRGLRLARRAAKQWRVTARKAIEDRERESRTLEALANVHVSIRSSPFKLHWAFDASQDQMVGFPLLSHNGLCHICFLRGYVSSSVVILIDLSCMTCSTFFVHVQLLIRPVMCSVAEVSANPMIAHSTAVNVRMKL